MIATQKLRAYLEKHSAYLAEGIYQGEAIEGVIDDVVRVAQTERGAKIIYCDRPSILEAVRTAASWPVRIGTDDGSALVVTKELITRGDSTRPRLIAMLTARAKIQILSRFGGLRWVNARCVYSGEDFEPEQGDDPRVPKHQDLTMYPQRRGQFCGAYVIGLQKHGLPRVVECMNAQDIDRIRKDFSLEFGDGELEDLDYFQQYAMAKAIHRFCGKLVGLRDDVREWLSEAPPRSKGTITSPVEDPKAVLEAAEAIKAAKAEAVADEKPAYLDPFPRHRHAQRAMSRL